MAEALEYPSRMLQLCKEFTLVKESSYQNAMTGNNKMPKVSYSAGPKY
jgi:hypothetical protein